MRTLKEFYNDITGKTREELKIQKRPIQHNINYVDPPREIEVFAKENLKGEIIENVTKQWEGLLDRWLLQCLKSILRAKMDMSIRALYSYEDSVLLVETETIFHKDQIRYYAPRPHREYK